MHTWPLILLFTLSAMPLFGADPAQPAPPRAPATRVPSPPLSPEAEALIRRYRMDDRLEVKLDALKSLGRLNEKRVISFLEREYEKLDLESPDHTRVAGVILQAWAARPDAGIVSYLLYEGLFHEDPAVVRSCAEGIALMPADARSILSTGRAAAGRDPADEMAVDLISRLIDKPELFHPLEKVLVIWSGKSRPGYQAAVDLAQRPDNATRTAGMEFWKKWFEERFKQTFTPVFEKTEAAKSDEEVYKFLLTESFQSGDAVHGAKVYESLRCQACHGGGTSASGTNRLLGPKLDGVGQRLSRTELADALVYPSRQVAEKFKTVAITLKDSIVLKGYITEQTEDKITLAGRAQVRRLERSKVESVEPSTESLMPTRTLNHASWVEIRDLMKYLTAHGTTVR